MKKIKLKSDGTILGTKVTDAETDEIIEGVKDVEYFISCDGIPCITITVINPDVEVDTQVFYGEPVYHENT